MSMEIVTTRDGHKTVFTLKGRLDTNTAQRFQDVLIPAFDASMAVELDFAELSYVSSAGLRVLLLGEKTAGSKGCSMTIVNAAPCVMEIFEVTGFSDILKIK